MIIYNRTALDNLHVQEQAHIAHQNKLITEAEEYTIKQAYPINLYHPNLWVRVSLFVLTLVICAFSLGLLCLMLAEANAIDSPVWPMLLGAGLYLALELMVKNNRYYKAGVDDALLWLSGALVTGGFIWMLSEMNRNSGHEIVISTFICVLSLILTLRFTNWLMSMLCCLAGLCIVFFVCQAVGTRMTAALPFILMLASGLLYSPGVKLDHYPQALHYKECLVAFRFTCLIALYAAGNYYLIDDLQQRLLGSNSSGKHQVAFGFIFWVWTIALPLAYIAIGLIKRNTLLLRTGLLVSVAAVATFRTYYHILPTAWALSLGGALLLLLVYALVRYLKVPKHGYTYAEQYTGNKADQINAESLITIATVPHAHAPVQEQSRFGGGSFGGGGSSSNF
ncbi:hypothetical protein GCM10027037_32010 [Mucilaginibacter koreensis]